MNYDDLLRELKMEAVSFPDISAEDLSNIIHALENHFCKAINDVELVVRCKDCRFRRGEKKDFCYGIEKYTKDDDFCSRGESDEAI